MEQLKLLHLRWCVIAIHLRQHAAGQTAPSWWAAPPSAPPPGTANAPAPITGSSLPLAVANVGQLKAVFALRFEQILDADNDYMMSPWETIHGFDPLIHDAESDSDLDGRSNLEEFQQGTDPNASDSSENTADFDADGMFDGWELENGLNAVVNDSALDPDNDGLTNIQEFVIRTNPLDRDTDSDRLPDLWEHQHGLNPRVGTGIYGKDADPDVDGLSNIAEYQSGSYPMITDTDNDGMSDGDEVAQGSNPADSNDQAKRPVDPVEAMTFRIYGDWAAWEMTIQGEGPRDFQPYMLVSPKDGEPAEATHPLKRNNKYRITLKHTGTRPNVPDTWYCVEAKVGGLPAEKTFNDYDCNRIPGVAEIFTIAGGKWVVDNRGGLLSAHHHKHSGNNGGGNVAEYLEAFLLPVEVGVDNNRDGNLALGSSEDQTTAEKPYRFWLNNDHDNYGQSDTYNAADDHPWTTQALDSANEKIESERDVEDFARLHLKIEGIRPALEAGTKTLGFKWKSVQAGTPKIRLFKAADIDGGTKYLSTEAKAADQVSLGSNSLGVVDGITTLDLPVSYWTSTTSSPSNFFLYEGLGEGKGELSVVIKEGNTVIGEGGSVFLDILDIRKMYERWKITDSAVIEDPDKDAVAVVTGVNAVKDDFSFPPEAAWDEDLSDKQYVISIHGWRKNYYKATSDEITMFKRLWHRGFKGKYIGFKWPTYDEPGVGLTPAVIASKFNHSEYRAWKCGEALKTFVSGLPSSYSKKIFAHSLGNVVVGSALERGMDISHYALLNAAIPASCYDKGAAPRTGTDPDFSDDTNPTVRALSYRGDVASLGTARLESVIPFGVITNFYLSKDYSLTGSLSWETNQDGLLTTGKPVDGYDYEPGIQVEWDTSIFNPPIRVVTDPQEAMSMVNQCKTKAAGAMSLGGRINANNDLDGPGMAFDEEHEAVFKMRCSKTWVFYQKLWESLELGPVIAP